MIYSRYKQFNTRPRQLPCHKLIVQSFPRSGNHLVRAFIEIATGKPTRGCPKTPSDAPIILNYLNCDLHYRTMERTSKKHFIGYKSHFQLEYNHNKRDINRQGFKCLTICIFRDPKDAIKSHMCRAVNEGLSGEEDLDRWTKQTINLYQQTIDIFESELRMTGQNALALDFAGLVSKSHLATWLKLYEFLQKYNFQLQIPASEIESIITASKLIARGVSTSKARNTGLLNSDVIKGQLSKFEKDISALKDKVRDCTTFS